MADSTNLADAATLVGEGQVEVRLQTALPDGDDRYRNEGVIGEGGMGVVASHFDRRIGRRVAKKALRPDLNDQPHIRARFLREVQVQGQLEHPAIVPVYDLATQSDGSLYFTMKTVRGVTLADVLDKLAAGDEALRKKHTRHRLLTAFTSVCLAIDYAHSRGIVHRDLKPANLIFGWYGEVYVLDWGLAKIRQGPEVELGDQAPSSPLVTHAGTFMGTPGYTAPEQIVDSSSVGPAADSYALGAILFEILTLQPLHPRGGEAIASTTRGVDARPSVRNPSCNAPPELEKLCVAATALDPQSRPTARELSDAVERYLEGERDLELRQRKAALHAQNAARAGTEVRSGADATLSSRRRAMQEIGRALALDPTNVEAISTLVELLAKPPENIPPELNYQIEREFRQDIRWVSSVGASVYASILGFLALVLWMGVKKPWIVVGFFALMMGSAVLSILVARSRRPRTALILLAMVGSGVAFTLATRFFSPLILVPSALAINATGYAIFLRHRQRLIVVVISCIALLAPLVLELCGVLSPSFRFEGGRLEILPVALSLPMVPTLLLLCIGSMMAMILGSILVGHIRDRLADAERRIGLYAWHLREFLPPDVRPATDPTRRRGVT